MFTVAARKFGDEIHLPYFGSLISSVIRMRHIDKYDFKLLKCVVCWCDSFVKEYLTYVKHSW